MNLDDLIATAQPRTEQVRVCVRGDLVERHAAAVATLRAAAEASDSLGGDPAVAEAAEAVRAIEDEQEASALTLTVTSVSRNRWADLLAKHPPTKEQRRAGHFAEPETFAIAVVAECVAELDADQAARLADVLPMAEWNKLESAALRLNATETPFPKLAAATEILQANGQSSTTAENEGSLAASSSDGSGAQ